jgi:predicted RNA-binding Zn-ribbon protein involved in translation (DUF1610 family)
MSFLKESKIIYIFALFGLLSLIFSFVDIIFDLELMFVSIALFIVLFVLLVITIIIRRKKSENKINAIFQFKKALKGGLFHFKCPFCEGFFAIKKSKYNNKKSVKLTCPDCGKVGIISPEPSYIENEIPEKKSIKASFKCNNCGEGISVWAEGSDLYKNMHVYSCPFCGKGQSMDKH